MEDNKSKADQNIEPIIEVGGTKYIPLDIAEVEYYEIIKQPDGSIILKPYIISVLLKDKQKGFGSVPDYQNQDQLGTLSKGTHYNEYTKLRL